MNVNKLVATFGDFEPICTQVRLPGGETAWQTYTWDPNCREFVRLDTGYQPSREDAETKAREILADTSLYARSLLAFAYEQMRAVDTVERAARDAVKALGVKASGMEMIREIGKSIEQSQRVSRRL